MRHHKRKLSVFNDLFAIGWLLVAPFLLIGRICKLISTAVQSINVSRSVKTVAQNYSGSRIPASERFVDMTGYDFEQYCAIKLHEQGYTNIDVTPKSGDFGADIIAISRDGKKTCFQCKKYTGPVGVKAVQEVNSAKSYYGCEIAAVLTNSAYTEAAYTLARATGVVLMTFWEPKG